MTHQLHGSNKVWTSQLLSKSCFHNSLGQTNTHLRFFGEMVMMFLHGVECFVAWGYCEQYSLNLQSRTQLKLQVSYQIYFYGASNFSKNFTNRWKCSKFPLKFNRWKCIIIKGSMINFIDFSMKADKDFLKINIHPSVSRDAFKISSQPATDYPNLNTSSSYNFYFFISYFFFYYKKPR